VLIPKDLRVHANGPKWAVLRREEVQALECGVGDKGLFWAKKKSGSKLPHSTDAAVLPGKDSTEADI
jgi:hypothetical protein